MPEPDQLSARRRRNAGIRRVIFWVLILGLFFFLLSSGAFE
jgi:hypothetical protein